MLKIRKTIYILLALSILLFSDCEDDEDIRDIFLGTYHLKGTYNYTFDNYGVYNTSNGTGSFDSTIIATDPDWEYKFRLGNGHMWLKLIITGNEFKTELPPGSTSAAAASGYLKGDSIYVNYGNSYRGSSTSWTLSGVKR